MRLKMKETLNVKEDRRRCQEGLVLQLHGSIWTSSHLTPETHASDQNATRAETQPLV